MSQKTRIAPTAKLSLLADRRGLSTVEYVIILCLIAVVCFGIWRNFGQMIETRINVANDTLSQMPATVPGS